jgi:peptidoglycan/xylan/chitin deacetylase (PgdA/CDA1 family)
MSALRRLARPALSATGRGKLTIFIYHRVRPDVDALFPGDLDARRFDEQLTWIASALNVLPLSEAIEMLSQDRVPGRAACITFDDGYRDNLEIGLPILRRHGLTATIFVASGFLDGGRMWNDTVIEAIRRAPNAGLDLGLLDMEPRRMGSDAERRVAIDEIIKHLKYERPAVRLARADALARLVGKPLPDDLMLTSDQVRELHAAGMAIGGHTVTHPILAQLDDVSARAEMRDGRDALQSILNAPVRLFAYPNGKPGDDYGPAHVAMVRELGFACALSTRRGAADASSDLYELPRFTPWGKNFLEFATQLGRNHLGHY